MLRTAEKDEKYATTVEIIRQIALTGCRRSEEPVRNSVCEA
jgi:hypothetical protein